MNSNNQNNPEKVVYIDSLSTFNSWKKELRAIRRNEDLTYLFNLSELTELENQNFTDHVKYYNNECGCTSGSFLMSLAFFLIVTWYFISGNMLNDVLYGDLLWLGGVTLFAGLAGKLLGLLNARWKLIKLSNQLNGKISTIYLNNLSTNS